MTIVVKRAGHTEEFDSRKIYASVYAACLNVHLHEGEAELIADKVMGEIKEWAKDQKEVTAHEIFMQTSAILVKYNPDAAYIYSTHRDAA